MSSGEIAWRAGLSTTTVKRSLSELLAANHLLIEQGKAGRRATLYRVNVTHPGWGALARGILTRAEIKRAAAMGARMRKFMVQGWTTKSPERETRECVVSAVAALENQGFAKVCGPTVVHKTGGSPPQTPPLVVGKNDPSNKEGNEGVHKGEQGSGTGSCGAGHPPREIPHPTSPLDALKHDTGLKAAREGENEPGGIHHTGGAGKTSPGGNWTHPGGFSGDSGTSTTAGAALQGPQGAESGGGGHPHPPPSGKTSPGGNQVNPGPAPNGAGAVQNAGGGNGQGDLRPPGGGGAKPKRRSREEKIARQLEFGWQILPPELDTPRFRQAWEDYVRHRNEMGKPLTETAIRYAMAKLRRWGPNKGYVAIVTAIENGWQGLWEPKGLENDRDVKVVDADAPRLVPLKLPQGRTYKDVSAHDIAKMSKDEVNSAFMQAFDSKDLGWLRAMYDDLSRISEHVSPAVLRNNPQVGMRTVSEIIDGYMFALLGYINTLECEMKLRRK